MRRVAVATSLATTLLLSTISAQHIHRGFWIGLAPGGAGVVHKEGFAYPLYLRLGGTVHQRLLVGVEWYGVLLDAEPSSAAANLTAVALLYPSRAGGFFTKVGVGSGRATSRCPDQHQDVAAGFGVTLGAGMDARIGRNVYLTPNLDVVWQGAARILCPVPGVPGAGTVLGYSPGLFFTVGMTWH